MRASCEKGRTCQENPYLWVKDQKTLDISGRVARSLLAHSMRLSGELDNFPLSQTALFVIGISLKWRTCLAYIPFGNYSFHFVISVQLLAPRIVLLLLFAIEKAVVDYLPIFADLRQRPV